MRVVPSTDCVLPFTVKTFAKNALSQLLPVFKKDYASESKFLEELLKVLKNIVAPDDEEIKKIIGLGDECNDLQLRAVFPQLKDEAFQELCATVTTLSQQSQHTDEFVTSHPASSAAVENIASFIRSQSVFKCIDTHTTTGHNRVLRTVHEGHIYPDITLVNLQCGDIIPSLAYTRAFLELKLYNMGPEEKGEVVEQLRTCLLNDRTRRFVWGGLVASRGVFIFFRAENMSCQRQNVQTMDDRDFISSIALYEYPPMEISAELGQRWFSSFLFASDAALGLTSDTSELCAKYPSLTNLYAFGALLGHGASGRVYAAEQKDNHMIVVVKIFHRWADYEAEKRNLTRINEIIDARRAAMPNAKLALVPRIVDDTDNALVMTPLGQSLYNFDRPRLNLDAIERLFNLFELLSGHAVYTDMRAENLVYVKEHADADYTICVIDWAFWIRFADPKLPRLQDRKSRPQEICGTLRFAAKDVVTAYCNHKPVAYTAAHGLESLVKFIYYSTVMLEQMRNAVWDAKIKNSRNLRELTHPWLGMEHEWADVLVHARLPHYEQCKNALFDALRRDKFEDILVFKDTKR